MQSVTASGHKAQQSHDGKIKQYYAVFRKTKTNTNLFLLELMR